MSLTNLFGQIVSPHQVEEAVVASLTVWLPDYLGELERIEGYTPGTIALPAGIITASEFEKWPEDQLPLILVMNGGLASKPIRRGNGRYEAEWLVNVAPIVADVDEVQTRRLASAYATACRAAVLQHKGLKSPLHPEGFAAFIKWRDEKYVDIPFAETRTLGSGQVIFSVGVEGVTTEQAGPREPITPAVDPGPLPAVTGVSVTVNPERAGV
jgi:hypothetical protein